MRQVITTQGVYQSTEASTGGTLAERGSGGELKSTYSIGETALNYPGTAGGIHLKQATKTTDYTATVSDSLICVTVGSSNRTVTLPAAASSQYQVITVKRLDATEFSLTVDGNASETIDGQASVLVNGQYESATFWCDGSNWHEVARSTPESFVAKSANFTAYGAKNFNITTAGSTITVTLPSAAVFKGQTLRLIKVDGGAGSVTLSATVAGATTGFLSGAGAQYDTIVLASDGTNWNLLADAD